MALERTGRRTSLGGEQRREVWALKESWDRALGDAGVRDFPDIILAARDHARRRPGPMYRAVIVDEAQDLTLVGLQLIRALVNGPDGRDRPDGLFIVGDGAQRIYAGGFTLRQAGVEVRGRTTVLRTNYRNTTEIIAAAMAVAGDQPVDDLGDQLLRGDAPTEARRDGARPKLVHCQDLDEEGKAVVQAIRHLVAKGRADLGDIAVATGTNAQADDITKLLAGASIPTINLGKYDGSPVDKVKVGTHFRIKGLEFKVVFLPRLGVSEFPRQPAPGQSEAETVERRALAVSQLFVAMTRARDELWLLATGDPSPILARSLGSFDLVEAKEPGD
jgi:superfamily I DNA/RNA helicase